MHSIISFSVTKRWLVMGLVLLLAGIGLYHSQKLPIDAVPDITNTQVQINTQASGYSPFEVEQRITFIVENAMAGIPQLDYTRSLSRYGLSQVTVVFEDGTDIYWAREQIAQRLQTLKSELPSNVSAQMGPIASGLGEVFSYAVVAEKDAKNAAGQPYSSEDLRTIQDWIIRPQLLTVKGITEINSLGGYERQYQVAPKPEQLLAYKIRLEDVLNTLKRNNQNIGAGYTERNGEQWLVRSPGQLHSLTDIENLVITMRDQAPVRIKDVADVQYGKELRSGAATNNGQETVLGTAMMLLGENSRTVAKAVAAKLEHINSQLPHGVKAVPVYDRTDLVDKTLDTVKTNLFEGAVLVITILFLLLGNIRAAIIAALVIPLSMLFAITGMSLNRVSGNLMSLGAIDFGIIVDGAVIVVENALRRLGLLQQQKGRLLSLEERLNEVRLSTQEVLQPAGFGVLIIMLVFMPIFALTGVEGKMFHPMAFTLIAALLGALIFSVTFVPAAIAIFVNGPVHEHHDGWFKRLQKGYQNALQKALVARHWVVAFAIFIITLSTWQATRLGSEFLPQLDEGDVALHALRIPGTALNQSLSMQMVLEKEVLSNLPEVATIFSKIGTAEVATDPMPPNVADTFLMLKPKEDWPNPNKSKTQLLTELRAVIEAVPGNNYELTQPIEMRFNELIAGVRADVAVRVYGDDFETLIAQAQTIEGLIKTISGTRDVRMEQADGLPMVSVEPQRDHLALLGLTVEDIQTSIQASINGIEAGQVYDGDKRFDLLVRLNGYEQADQLKGLPVHLPYRSDNEIHYVPLGEVANVIQTEGPNQINRRSGKRNIVVTANVQGRDLGSVVDDIQTKLNDTLELPAGYWLEYGGTFEQLESASKRLTVVIPLTLLLIFALLYSAFGRALDAALIFSAIPLALTGGVLALTLRGMPFSISAAVGFIALSGVAVLNGVVMVSFIQSLRDKGLEVTQAILEGAAQRLRPVLMTALVASLGFIPMALNTGTGAEVQRPLATVVIGGIISSTILTLFVLPGLYQWAYQNRKTKSQS